MKTYEIIATTALFLMAAMSGWHGIKTIREAGGLEGKEERAAARRKAFSLLALGLVFLFGALYILLRVSWLFWTASLIGGAAVAYTMGAGIIANMREH